MESSPLTWMEALALLLRFMKSTIFFFWVLIITFWHFSFLAMLRLKARVEGRAPSQTEAHKIATLWGQRLLKSVPGWDIQVRGVEYLPPEGSPCVLVANHESSTDILAIYFLGIQFRWLSKKSMFQVPLVGMAMRWAGYVPIVRGNKGSHQQALSQSEAYVRQGIPMLFFPEGTRSVKGTPGEFKTGAFRLAQACAAPVLPVVLCGAGRLLRKKSLYPEKATVKIQILPLMEALPGESAQNFTQRVRDKICEAHALLLAEERPVSGHSLTGECHEAEPVC
ncbi:MAG: 1-acyl-sn-glycerol-3-phosphate acyltransferase [Deltaproteobacteria bacterium]|nr:1-acyl-sn-glycerol-3-phosphate acyltransferase [Deltaproteobacteria bacterium]